MTPRWQLPFCDAPHITGADQLGGRYQIAFTREQINNAFFNVNTYKFTINGVQDILDAQLEITGAMAVLSMGTLIGLGIAIAPILGSAAQRVGVSGTMVRRFPGEHCDEQRIVFNANLCYIEINFGDVKRRQFGNSAVYFPRCTMIFYASGYVWANDLTFLFGAGEAIGAVDWGGSSGAFTTVYCVGGSGPPVGSPSLFGAIQIDETMDAMTFGPRVGPVGTQVALAGITFGNVQEVWMGNNSCTFALAGDQKTVTITVPAGAKTDYFLVRNLLGGEFVTRQPFVVTP